MSRQTTLGRFGFKKSISHRNSVMEMKVPGFVSTMSRTIKCNHCSKLFVNQQGLSVHEKCVHGSYRCFNTQNYIYPFQNLILGFILKIFLKFRKFQPRYSYKIKKKECILERLGSFTLERRAFCYLPRGNFSQSMSLLNKAVMIFQFAGDFFPSHPVGFPLSPFPDLLCIHSYHSTLHCKI